MTSRRTAAWCAAIEDGYLQGLIADEAFKIHQEVESGERPVVGVNKFVVDEPAPDIGDLRTRTPRAATCSSSGWRRSRPSADDVAVKEALAALARGGGGR